MPSLFRSEEMTLGQLFLQSDSAYACVSELGELGLVEFRDLNPDVNAFQRKFVNEVRRCDEMERKLRFFQKEIERADINILNTIENPDAPHPREMIDLEAQFEQLENEMKDSNANYEQLQRSFLELTELKQILRKTQTFFEEAELHVQQQQQQQQYGVGAPPEELSLLGGDNDFSSATGGRLGFVAGVIARERIPTFERLLWRACRGNVFFKQAEIDTVLEDPSTGDEVHKCVFIIFFQGDQLKLRVKKICEGFRATLYPCPETPAERREMAIGVMTRIEDLQTVLSQTQDHRHRLLQTIAKNISIWFIKVRKIKAIYHTMNMFNLDVTQKCLIAECWCPVTDLDKIQTALRRGTERSGASVPSILNQMHTKQEPPTFNRTNKLTSGFQAIVDAYGVANYQEVNPALYAIITFPFLFSVMFGDFGHGTLMFLFALFLVVNERKLANFKAGGEMFDTIFAGRYIVLLMGLFSIQAGLIYNDIFSKSVNIFGSGWVDFKHVNGSHHMAQDYNVKWLEERAHEKPNELIMLDPRDAARDIPYYFGLDPVWQLAVNKLTFTNSFKMKISIIFGVTHMMFGIIMGLFNHLHFKQHLNIWCEFIPQVLFLGCIFGYLVVLIFYKWIAYDVFSSTMPSLLLTLIGMFLDFAKPITDDKRLFAGQESVQTLLVIVAVLCVPWMLLVKPFILKHRHAQKKGPRGFRSLEEDRAPFAINDGNGHITSDSDDGQSHANIVKGGESSEADEEEFDFGDVFVHQAIHTIEFCLGCISNTASYLRLWALSLAHAQLSEVLWSMVFHTGLIMEGIPGAFIVFAVFYGWALMTIAILLLMEGLSAFLHTLRLHWVEFQGKFYVGNGHKFLPFCFKTILEETEA